MVHFTIGASSGRQGSRTLISVGRTALAERPGKPYPATFHQWTHRGSNPDFQSAELVSSRWMDSNHRYLSVGQGSLPLDHGTNAVAEVGIEPTIFHQALDLAGFEPASYGL